MRKPRISVLPFSRRTYIYLSLSTGSRPCHLSVIFFRASMAVVWSGGEGHQIPRKCHHESDGPVKASADAICFRLTSAETLTPRPRDSPLTRHLCHPYLYQHSPPPRLIILLLLFYYRVPLGNFRRAPQPVALSTIIN